MTTEHKPHSELLLKAVGELETLRNSTQPLGYPDWAHCEQAIVALGEHAKGLDEMLREAEDTLRINGRGPELIGLRHRIVKVLGV